MPEWQVIIYADGPGNLTHAQQETIGEAGRTLGYEKPAGKIRLTGRAEHDKAAAAAASAEEAFLSACRRAGAEVMVREVRTLLWEDYEAEQGAPRAALAGVAEAAEILGVVRQRVPQLLAEHAGFPQPVARLKSGPVWEREQIEAFKRTWPRQNGRPRKPSPTS